jgi:VWFA-related protein
MGRRAQIITIATVVALANSGWPQQETYTLKLNVNEVSLSFHVADKQRNAIAGLSQADFQVFDNGEPQHNITNFHSYRDLPIRAGFLMDASGSMQNELDRNQLISNLYAARLPRKGTDRAFVMGFGTEAVVTQDWTDDPDAIVAGLGKVRMDTTVHPVRRYSILSTERAAIAGRAILPRSAAILFCSLVTASITPATLGLMTQSISVNAPEQQFTHSRTSGM